MKYVYHGSSISNLKIIKPNKSTHMKKYVYATPSKAIATIFLSNKGNDLYYYLAGDGINSKVVLVERKEGMFKEIFNRGVYIYKLDATNFKSGLTSWSAEVVSDKEEKVISKKYIKNVYNELLKLHKKGLIKLYLYPNRPSNIPLDNSDLIPKVISWYKKGINIELFKLLYPELTHKLLCEINNIE